MNTKTAKMLVLVGILFGASAAVLASDEYFVSPAEGIMCTVRAQNPDGSRDAVGTDFTDPRQFSMETLHLSAGGLTHQAWIVDRETDAVSEGGYNVFRKHCAPLMRQLPDDLKQQFEQYFAN